MSELGRRAGVAIRLALQDDERSWHQLEGYLAEMTEADQEELWAAVRTLDGALANALTGDGIGQ